MSALAWASGVSVGPGMSALIRMPSRPKSSAFRAAEERVDRSAAVLDRAVDALPVGEVEADLGHARRRGWLDVEHDDVRAQLPEHLGRRRPDPRRPADDDGP